MATSIATMEIMDIPQAVRNAVASGICRSKTRVSNAIDVKSPLTMASDMIAITAHSILDH